MPVYGSGANCISVRCVKTSTAWCLQGLAVCGGDENRAAGAAVLVGRHLQDP
jgi:hypothetical protein